jgi:hypothetical protein
MKTYGIFIIGIIGLIATSLLSCGNRQGNKKIEINNIEKDFVTKIKIRKVSFYMTTIAHVDCGEYESWFNAEIRTHVVKNRDSISMLISIIDNLQTDTLYCNPDTRAKLFIYHHNNTTDTLCMGLGGILLNGKSFFLDKKLIEIVDEL